MSVVQILRSFHFQFLGVSFGLLRATAGAKLHEMLSLRRCFTITVRSLVRSKSSASAVTVDQNEVGRFSQLASSDLWNEFGPMKPLHSMNKLRVPLVTEKLASSSASALHAGVYLPLKSRDVLDVGCGVGILAEPLARLGANVTGLDASAENVEIASAHSLLDAQISGRVTYISSSIENFNANTQRQFDAVVASEVLEHVADRRSFLIECTRAVKPNGYLFLTTLNRTWAAQVFGIWLAESSFIGIVPKGIHEFSKFTPPEDVTEILAECGMRVTLIHGMCYNPVWNDWQWTSSTAVNYALCAVRD